MKDLIKLLFCLALCVLTTFKAKAQATPKLQMNPWKQDQLIEPQVLAGLIESKKKIIIYNIGVVENIKGAIQMGAASDSANIVKLKSALLKVPKNRQIVIYCGCCPMGKCPNIRPAFQLLSDMNFSNINVLDLHTNIKTDWIDKGYPVD